MINWNDIFKYKNGWLYYKTSYHYKARTGVRIGTINSKGYYIVSYKRNLRLGHRIIWQMFNGNIPGTQMIDHIDNNKANNRIENLRLSDKSKNGANKRKHNGKHKYKGIVKTYNNKFMARVKHMGKQYHAGTYKTEIEAARAYDRKATEIFGEHALLNFSRSENT